MKKIAIVLASGIGSRVSKITPKQFMLLNNKHVLSYSVSSFLDNDKIDKTLVVVSKENLEYAKEILSCYIDINNISFVIGGSTRTDSVNNAIEYIKYSVDITDNDIVLVHDSARPLLEQTIIDDSIEKSKYYDCLTVAVGSTDTVTLSKDGKTIDQMLNRDEVYNIQTPQTFKINEYIKCFENIKEERINLLTDSTKVFIENNKTIGIVKGNKKLLKITTKEDFNILESFIKRED